MLLKHMDLLDTERIISLIQAEKFDYTKWRQGLFPGISGQDISKMAMDSLDE